MLQYKSTLMAGLLMYAKKMNALRMIAYYYALLRFITRYCADYCMGKTGTGQGLSGDKTKDQDNSTCFQRWVYPTSEIFCIGIKLMQNCCGCRYNKLARLANFVAIFQDHRNFPGDIGLTRE